MSQVRSAGYGTSDGEKMIIVFEILGGTTTCDFTQKDKYFQRKYAHQTLLGIKIAACVTIGGGFIIVFMNVAL